MSITTRNGDKGRTRLFSGQDVSKADLAPRAYGALDEAVSVLGIARSLTDSESLAEHLLYIQNASFEVGAELATHPDDVARKRRRVDEAFVAILDKMRDDLEAVTPIPKDFVIPGGNPVAAHLDHARCVYRRCEQEATALWNADFLKNPLVLVWLNRVSDHLWLLARQMEGKAVIPRRSLK
ncbi:cob(I)yrinic acid a,c-diamide adenosyltransferase [Kiritimatiellota bacterium B12222]|nr:cob(I)yrinic acid a,c-diamide adenosyltransferase [Kiritimatiellota bacterium B12222]